MNKSDSSYGHHTLFDDIVISVDAYLLLQKMFVSFLTKQYVVGTRSISGQFDADQRTLFITDSDPR